MVLGVMLAGEEHEQPAGHGFLDAFHHARHPGEAEERAHAQQRNDGVRAGLGGDAPLQAIHQVSDELGQFAALVTSQVLWDFEVGVAVLLGSHPLGEGVRQVNQHPLLADLLGDQRKLIDVGTQAEFIGLVVHGEDHPLDGGQASLPGHREVLPVGGNQLVDPRRHDRPPGELVLLPA